MKKLFFLFSLLMCFSIGQVWGADVTFNYSDYKGQGTSSSGSAYTMSDKDDVTIGDTKFYGNNSYAHFYADGVTTITPASGVTITQIVFTASAASYNGYQSSGTMTWSTGSSSANGATVTWTGEATAAFTLTHNKQIRWTSIVVTYNKSSGGTPTCATPTFNPAAGSYEGTQNVTITSTSGATIYYTTDGSTPSTSSSVYSAAIPVAADMTIKAYAVKANYNDSEVAEAAYIITEGPDVTINLLDEGWGFPNSKVVDETSYTNGDYTVKVAGTSGNGFRTYDTYFLLGQSGAYIELPAFANPIEKIVVTGNSGGSDKVTWNIFKGDDDVSTAVTGCKNDAYTFNINPVEANVVYSLKVTNAANLQIKAIKIYFGEAPDVASPTISGDVNFVTSTEVSLSCSTNGATIYYTTNGNDPKTSGTAYSTPFTLNATATVKAAAKVGNDWSAVAEKTFTKVEALTTMDAIFAKATEVGSTATDVYITFNNWVVSGVKNSNVYVTDGTKGLIIYQSSHGFAIGNVLSGTVACKVQLYNGSSEITSLTSSTTGLTVTTGGTVTPVELDASGIEALTGVNTGSVIKISGECTTSNSKYYIAGVQLYNQLYTFDNPTTEKNYDCTGVYLYYKNGNNAAINEVLPRSAADIVEVVEEGAPATPTFSPAAGTYTEVKSVTITCTTEGATIYYTTDGSTPTSASRQYTAAISVGETMTIKAIAIKNSLESAVATAAYTINLPEDENTSKTWDLSKDETASASEEELTWTATYVDMSVAKGTSSTNANNYYPGTPGNTHTRIYKNSVLTITPKGDKKITKIYIVTTGKTYADALISSTWSNAVAAAYSSNTSIVEVTPTKTGAISATIGGASRLTEVRVEYEDAPHVAVTGVTLDQSAVTLKAGRSTTLVATVAPDDANNQNVTWSSSNEAIATVANGEVTAVAIGNATITVTTEDGEKTATCVVTVIDPSTRFEPLAAFQKVTATENITNGDYLIVYESEGTYLAFDGGLETLDGAHNNIEVTIEDGYIKAPGDAIFTIDVTNGTIRSYSGAYIGVSTNSNGLKQSSSADTYTNSFSISEGNVVISAVFTNSTMSLRYNKGTNDKRFRYYKDAGQQAIQLYKKVDPTSIRGDLTAGSWGTFCSAKKVLVPSGASFFTIAYVNMQAGVPAKVYFDEIGEGESLQAGKPYIYIANDNAITGVLTGNAVAQGLNDNGFVGVLSDFDFQVNSDATRNKYYVIYGNQIRLCADGYFKLLAGRAYIDAKDANLPTREVAAPAPGRRRIGLDNPAAPQVLTDIEATQTTGKAVKMMIGEQLFILRDGKLYDTTGRFITNMQ